MIKFDKIMCFVGDVTAVYVGFRLFCNILSLVRKLLHFLLLFFYILLAEIKYTSHKDYDIPTNEHLTDPATVAAIFLQAKPGTPPPRLRTIPEGAAKWTEDLVLPWGDHLFSSDDDDDNSLLPKMSKRKKAVRFMMDKVVKVKRTRSHRRMIGRLRRETATNELGGPKSRTDGLKSNEVETESLGSEPKSLSDEQEVTLAREAGTDTASLENFASGAEEKQIDLTSQLQSLENSEVGEQEDEELTALFRSWGPDVEDIPVQEEETGPTD